MPKKIKGKCTYPDCFSCTLPDCTKEDYDLNVRSTVKYKCKSCKYFGTLEDVGGNNRNRYYCKKRKKLMSQVESRTSPKWCHLREENQ